MTERWFTARRGRITASKRAEIIALGRPTPWAKLVADLNYDLGEDYIRESFTNEAMAWGNDHELEAIGNIELKLGADLVEPGLVFHRHYSYAAATPDAYIDADTTVQIKCPFNPDNHLKYVYGGAKGAFVDLLAPDPVRILDQRAPENPVLLVRPAPAAGHENRVRGS